MAYSVRGLTLCNPGAPAGGKLFTYFTSTDAIATVVASGYFNSAASQIATNDVVIIMSTDEHRICRLINTANVITVGVDLNFA